MVSRNTPTAKLFPPFSRERHTHAHTHTRTAKGEKKSPSSRNSGERATVEVAPVEAFFVVADGASQAKSEDLPNTIGFDVNVHWWDRSSTSA